MKRWIEWKVRTRAEGVCEYCRMPEDLFCTPFQIDHIIARQHGGRSESDNLAFACFHCNLHKGPNIAGIDPRSGRMVRLFHPRRDRWEEHFEWRGPVLIGRTPIGRTTVTVLDMNSPDYIGLRESMTSEGRFPPTG